MKNKPSLLIPGIMTLVCMMLLVFNQLYVQNLFMKAIEAFIMEVPTDETLVKASDLFLKKMHISFFMCMGIITILLLTVLWTFRRLMISFGHEILDNQKHSTQQLSENQRLEEANRNMLDSIKYAKLIQSSLLPDEEIINEFIPHNFIIWQPRDLVGGDIFYFYPIVKNLTAHEDGLLTLEDGMIIIIVDCTGHGVPGAFMTMIASSGIRRIIRDEGCVNPSEILTRLNMVVKRTLYQNVSNSNSDDGMDVGVCFLKPQENQLIFAGARIPLLIVKDQTIEMVKGDRCSIGYRKTDPDFEFTNHTIDLEANMSLYLYTDGVVDQTGGQKGFPFGNRRLKELLVKYSDLPMNEQKKMIMADLEAYRGKKARLDDLTMVGFMVKNLR